MLKNAMIVFRHMPLLMIAVAWGQNPPEQERLYRVEGGVTPPTILHKVEPEYSDAARNANVQGTVVFEAVVGANGLMRSIAVISPVGFGLDEKAQTALEQWRFRPAQKDGKAVSVLALVEVNFRLLNEWYDEKAEHRRTLYNTAIAQLDKAKPVGSRERHLKTLRDLADKKYPPAMLIVSRLIRKGDIAPRKPGEAQMLLEAAAKKNHGPALFDLGKAHCDGADVPRDCEKGMKLIAEAAVIGSAEAQFALGSKFEREDPPKARRYFRLCAAAGRSVCQYRLGSMLSGMEAREERDYLQALAWLELAASGGETQAAALLKKENPDLTAGQRAWVNRLKSQLVRKQ